MRMAKCLIDRLEHVFASHEFTMYIHIHIGMKKKNIYVIVGVILLTKSIPTPSNTHPGKAAEC